MFHTSSRNTQSAKEQSSNLGLILPLNQIKKEMLKLTKQNTAPDLFKKKIAQLLETFLHCKVYFQNNILSPCKNKNFFLFNIKLTNKNNCTLIVEKNKTNLIIEKSLKSEEFNDFLELLELCLTLIYQTDELNDLANESEQILRFAPDIIFVISPCQIIKMANQKALELTGETEDSIIDKHLVQILGSATPQINDLLSKSEHHGGFEAETSTKIGRRLTSFNVSLIGQNPESKMLLLVGRDITTIRQAELTLRNSQRSTIMAQTIDYLIHQVNNPLAAIISSISMAQKRQKQLKDSKIITHNDNEEIESKLISLEKSLEGAQKAGLRINETMRTISAINRNRKFTSPSLVDPTKELNLAIFTIEKEYKDAKIQKELDNLQTIIAQPLYLTEIFASILKNAAEAAISFSKTPLIHIRGKDTEDGVHIYIEDTGPGIPEEYQDKIFMPFFTTKPIDKAMGLGLSMALDMTRRIGGKITVYNSANYTGAGFYVYFPKKSNHAKSLIFQY